MHCPSTCWLWFIWIQVQIFLIKWLKCARHHIIRRIIEASAALSAHMMICCFWVILRLPMTIVAEVFSTAEGDVVTVLPLFDRCLAIRADSESWNKHILHPICGQRRVPSFFLCYKKVGWSGQNSSAEWRLR